MSAMDSKIGVFRPLTSYAKEEELIGKIIASDDITFDNVTEKIISVLNANQIDFSAWKEIVSEMIGNNMAVSVDNRIILSSVNDNSYKGISDNIIKDLFNVLYLQKFATDMGFDISASGALEEHRKRL